MDKELKTVIEVWETFQDHQRNGTMYLSDLDFDNYFDLTSCDEYISTVFEFLEGESGFGKSVEYTNLHIPHEPLYLNFKTLHMSLLDDESDRHVQILNKFKLSVYNPSFIVTTSVYLKPICMLLFSEYKAIEGVNYLCNNLIHSISHILPQYLQLKKKLCCDSISLPFSIQFLDQLNCGFDIKQFHSQIENKIYYYAEEEDTTAWSK